MTPNALRKKRQRSLHSTFSKSRMTPNTLHKERQRSLHSTF